MSATEESLVTAYALNELEGAELAQVELLLQRDAAAKAEVQAIQTFGGALSAALIAEPIPQASSEAKQGSFSAFVRWLLPIAAALVVGLGISQFARRKSTSVHPAPLMISHAGVVDLAQSVENRTHWVADPIIGVPQVKLSRPAMQIIDQPIQPLVAGSRSSALGAATVVPRATPMLLSLKGGSSSGPDPAALPSNPIRTRADLEMSIVRPLNANLRPNFSYQSPVRPRFGLVSGNLSIQGAGDKASTLGDAPWSGDKIYDVLPDPQF